MPRSLSLASFAAVQCFVFGLALTAPAQAETIPTYFFKEWTITSNCTEAHAGLAARVDSGLKFKITKDTGSQDGRYVLHTADAAGRHWAANWNGLRLEYRAGTKMAAIPADFECIPGAESSSSFLAMSGYVVTAEPYYEQEHWYGLAKIHGQLEHVLIFPRDVNGENSAVIVLQSAASPAGAVKLDDDGVIMSRD
jgi:hypothetical protein